MPIHEPEPAPELPLFDHRTAWELGRGLVDLGLSTNLGLTISIWMGEQRVFHAALPGTSADNDRWVERKARIVRHFATSSAQVNQTYVADGDVMGFLQAFALPFDLYFPAGGAVPIVVGGCTVGVLAISGLPSDQDHAVAVEALHRLVRGQSEGGSRA